MVKAATILIAGLFLGASASAQAAVMMSALHPTPLISGVSGVFDADDAVFRRSANAGGRFVHIVLQWRVVAPKSEPSLWDPENPEDPNYAWQSVDALVMAARNAQLTPVIDVSTAPHWAQRCFSGRSVCNPYPEKFAAFSRAAARRYSGHVGGLPHVRYWQGLNEPNLSLFFQPQFEGGRTVSPTLYRRLLNAFYRAVKSVNRSNIVLAAGLGPVAVPKYTIGPLRFARMLLCMRGRQRPRPTRGNCEGGVHFDIFDIHPYTTGGPGRIGGPNDVQLGSLDRLNELIAAADRAGRIKGRFKRTPLWATEFGWTTNPPHPGGLPMQIATRWTAEAMFRFWRARVSHVFWYQIRDPARPPYQSGLYFRGAAVADDKPKPIMYAFRFPFVAYSRKDGFFFWGRTPNSKRGRVVIQIRKGGRWRNALVTRADKFGIFQGVVKGGYGRHRRGFVRALYHGERAVPFSLKPVKGFHQPPFGKPVPE